VAMHRSGTAKSMQLHPHYEDVVAEVPDLLVARAAEARGAGVDEVWIDPGIGFGKTVDHNLALLGALGELVATGYPVLVGTSRKSFLGSLAAAPGSPPVPVDQRLPGSLATATWAMSQGVQMVRVHDVAATRQAAVLVGRPERDPDLAGVGS
jgi:dihydropteroate synthase